jgi:hypothetical protein
MKLTQKLILLFVLIGLVPFGIIGIYSYYNSSTALKEREFNFLQSTMMVKKWQLEAYFQRKQKQINVLSSDTETIEAIEELSAGFAKLDKEISKDYDRNIARNQDMMRSRYVYQQEHTFGASTDSILQWMPQDKNAQILQYLYITANSFPIDKKNGLDNAGDGSSYSHAHKKIHPHLRNYIDKFNFYDVLLIDSNTGRVVYSCEKEIDLGTNLISGPFSKSNLAKAFETARNSTDSNFTFLIDIDSKYAPSYNKPSMFIAAPIVKNNKNIGVIALQISIEQTDNTMTNNRQWTNIGMGATGESVIIGDDHYLRSNSRFFIESPEKFLASLKKGGVTPEIINEIQREGTTICNLKDESESAKNAFSGRSKDNIIAKGYRGVEALITYVPLEIPGVKWALMSKIDKDEAFASVDSLRNAMLILGFILVIIVFGVGLVFARSISNPLNKIINSLSATSTQIASTIEEHERIASQQSASVNETTTTMDELGASSRQSAEQAEASAVGARQAFELASQGKDTVSEMKDNMLIMREKIVAIAEQILNLSEQTSQIATVTNLVSDFANETKMLAMNAAVEAVRAGEFGKGFSVVAMEIRKLADQSKGSTERINALVSDIQKSTNSTVMVTEEGSRAVENVVKQVAATEETFNEIVASINSSTESSQQISLNVKQQAVAIKQIAEAMNNLNTGAKETANGIAQTKQGVQNLDEAAQTLKIMV